MSKDTRSKATLSGNIREYILENSSSNMPEDTPPPVTEAQDVKTLLTLMTKTFTALELRSSTGQHNTKLEECPLKRTSSSLDGLVKKDLLWDESNTGNDPGLSAKKYLKFLDSVYKSKVALI